MTLLLVQQLEYILQLMTQCSSFTLNISNKRLMSAVYKELSHTDIKHSESKDLIFK